MFYLITAWLMMSNQIKIRLIKPNRLISILHQQHFLELQKRLKIYPEKSEVLYGTRKHTQLLLSFLGEERRIFGLTDNDLVKYGQTLMGYTVYDLNEVSNTIKAIVIFSDVYQEVIYDRIKHLDNLDIIKIY